LCVAGRRSGKTKAAATFAVYLSTCCDWTDSLSLGERGLSLFLAPTTRQAGVAHRYAESIIDHVELLRGLVESRTGNALALQRDIDLVVEPASRRFSRGPTAICITLDEPAFLYTGDDVANSDEELLIALQPSLSTTGGPLVLISSPAHMEGLVHRLWKRHFGAQGDPRIMVVQAASTQLNPKLRKETVARAFEQDAVAAAAEFGGQFRSPGGNYLERSIIEHCVEPGITQRPALPGVSYVGRVDVIGGSGTDSYCACVGHRRVDDGRSVVVIDGLFERRPPLNPDFVTAECAAWLAQYGIHTVTGDAYASEWPISQFSRHGIAYQSSALSASELYLHSLPAWTAGRVAMLDHARAIDQLCGLKRKLGQAAREIISHVRGGHDDLSVVIAGVITTLTPAESPGVCAMLAANPGLGPSIVAQSYSSRFGGVSSFAGIARHDPYALGERAQAIARRNRGY
jgi:hypothetical protein